MNVLNALLIAGAILLWILSMVSLTDLHGSDAAGNGLALSFGVFASIGLWIALLILLAFSAMRGRWPGWTKWAGFVLAPACAAANFIAIDLLNDTFYKAKWPIVVPGVAPVLLIAYAVWTYYPSLKAGLPAGKASGAVWGMVLILSLVPWPEYLYRSKHKNEDQAKAEAAFKPSRPASPKEWKPNGRPTQPRSTSLARTRRCGTGSHLRARKMRFACRPSNEFDIWRGGSPMLRTCSAKASPISSGICRN